MDSTVYIDAPTIPEGMTVDEYRRSRAQRDAHRLLSRIRRRHERPTPTLPTRIDSPAMTRHRA